MFRSFIVAAVFCAVCLSGVVGAMGAVVIRCDFQSSNTHDGHSSVSFVGVESQAATANSVFGSSGSNIWNYLSLPSAYNATVNPSFSNFVDSSGLTTSVGLSFIGTTGAAIDSPIDNSGSNALENDYFVINAAPLTSISAQFTISGLPPNTPVTMALYAPNFFNLDSINPYDNGNRGYFLSANGSVVNVPSGPDGSFTLATLTSDSSGLISGTWSTNGNDGNWSGMQLAYTIPEPSSFALLIASGGAFVVYGWRNRRRYLTQ